MAEEFEANEAARALGEQRRIAEIEEIYIRGVRAMEEDEVEPEPLPKPPTPERFLNLNIERTEAYAKARVQGDDNAIIQHRDHEIIADIAKIGHGVKKKITRPILEGLNMAITERDIVRRQLSEDAPMRDVFTMIDQMNLMPTGLLMARVLLEGWGKEDTFMQFNEFGEVINLDGTYGQDLPPNSGVRRSSTNVLQYVGPMISRKLIRMQDGVAACPGYRDMDINKPQVLVCDDSILMEEEADDDWPHGDRVDPRVRIETIPLSEEVTDTYKNRYGSVELKLKFEAVPRFVKATPSPTGAPNDDLYTRGDVDPEYLQDLADHVAADKLVDHIWYANGTGRPRPRSVFDVDLEEIMVHPPLGGTPIALPRWYVCLCVNIEVRRHIPPIVEALSRDIPGVWQPIGDILPRESKLLFASLDGLMHQTLLDWTWILREDVGLPLTGVAMVLQDPTFEISPHWGWLDARRVHHHRECIKEIVSVRLYKERELFVLLPPLVRARLTRLRIAGSLDYLNTIVPRYDEHEAS